VVMLRPVVAKAQPRRLNVGHVGQSP
jgi:hypothetical protein